MRFDFLIVVLTLLILFSGCSQLEPPSSMGNKCLFEEGSRFQALCITNLAIDGKDPTICNKLLGSIYYTDCLYMASEVKAAETMDVKACDSLPTTPRVICYSDIAIKSNDDSKCDGLDANERDVCLFGRGLMGYVDSCLKIQDASTFDDCLLQGNKIIQDFGTCTKIKSATVRETCFEEIPYSKQTVELCGSISDKTKKDKCFYNIAERSFYEKKEFSEDVCKAISDDKQGYYGGPRGACLSFLFALKQDLNGCDSISSENNRNSCYSMLAKQKNDVNVCSKISDEGIRDGFCVRSIAVSQKDPQMCRDIVNEYERNNCLEAVAIPLSNAELCQEITVPPGNRSNCYFTIAKLLNRSDLCETGSATGGNFDRDDCYYTIAQMSSSIPDCLKISVKDVKDKCLTFLAVFLKDSEICSKIEEGGEHSRDYCIAQAAISEGSVSKCGSLYLGAKNICYEGIALWKKDKNICQNVDTPYYLQAKEDCINNAEIAADFSSVMKTGDFKRICYRLELNSQKRGCIRSLAKMSLNSAMCQSNSEEGILISDKEKVSKCIAEIDKVKEMLKTKPCAPYESAASNCASASFEFSPNIKWCTAYPEKTKDLCYWYYAGTFGDSSIAACHLIKNEKLKENCFIRITSQIGFGQE